MSTNQSYLVLACEELQYLFRKADAIVDMLVRARLNNDDDDKARAMHRAEKFLSESMQGISYVLDMLQFVEEKVEK